MSSEQLRSSARLRADRSRPGPFLAPATSWGLKTRNALLRNRFVLGSMLKATKQLTTTLSLPAYPNPTSSLSSNSLQ